MKSGLFFKCRSHEILIQTPFAFNPAPVRNHFHCMIFRFLLRKLFPLLKIIKMCLLQNFKPRLHEEPVALSIHLTSHRGALSKQSKRSVSNINIWSQSSSCLPKYSPGKESVAPSQASCCVYYFSVWPLTYRRRRNSCLWKHETSALTIATNWGESKKNYTCGG